MKRRVTMLFAAVFVAVSLLIVPASAADTQTLSTDKTVIDSVILADILSQLKSYITILLPAGISIFGMMVSIRHVTGFLKLFLNG